MLVYFKWKSYNQNLKGKCVEGMPLSGTIACQKLNKKKWNGITTASYPATSSFIQALVDTKVIAG